MRAEKKTIYNLTKCYSIAPLRLDGEQYLLVAAEKTDRCLLFDTEGNLIDTVWEQPGGTMSMVQVPGTNGQFLATHRFYSPNDSKNASIVTVTPRGKGDWRVQTLVKLPFVHRFDIVERGGVNWIIACALKSGHEYKDDWRFPGKVYAAPLPGDLSSFDDDNQLRMEIIAEGLGHNHGYSRYFHDGIESSVISADSGVFLFTPPAPGDSRWEIEELISDACSDALLCDLDGDGEPELCTISPFHGDRISIYKKAGGRFERVYEYGEPAEFSHAICCGEVCGRMTLIIGYRKGKRNLLAFYWDGEKFISQILDENVGPANACLFKRGDEDVLIAANRETDEVAMYTFTED